MSIVERPSTRGGETAEQTNKQRGRPTRGLATERGAAGEQDNKERSKWREAPAGDTAMKPATRTPDDIRIGACADYILGRPIQKIEERWGVRIETVIRWIKRTGSFKTRQSQAKRGEKRREASPD